MGRGDLPSDLSSRAILGVAHQTVEWPKRDSLLKYLFLKGLHDFIQKDALGIETS